MINKKNLWFLTLFSLILVLSVYYITMPSELLLTNNSDYITKETSKEEDSTVDSSNVTLEESDILSAMRVEADETLLEQLDSLKLIMMDKDATVEEKNQAFDKMKELNINKAEEKELEKKIEETYKLKTFIKRDGDKIKVVVNSDKHDTQLANNIMRSIQENYENKMYITVQFK